MQPLRMGLLTLCMASVVGLTACQSNPIGPHPHGDHDKKMHMDKDKKWGPEQKEAREERKAQQRADKKALDDACRDRVGQTVAFKVGDRTVQGQCETRFQPMKDDMRDPKRGDLPPPPPSATQQPVLIVPVTPVVAVPVQR